VPSGLDHLILWEPSESHRSGFSPLWSIRLFKK
jgi:hypothetical protein